ncbi:sensor histidine kinase [Derxia gummosa]|uniref:histidine kinase n=1 Tax=Derxia gummosa DSM 723 TaxID=1121388 RepID=A0A8B6X928_9BURK|nr:ATP-binding protein [Derxia gummosa]
MAERDSAVGGRAGAPAGPVPASSRGRAGPLARLRDWCPPLPARFNTLAARLMLLLGVTVLLLQLVSFGGVRAIRDHETGVQMYAFMAADLDLQRDFLRSLPVEQRAAWLPKLNRGYYRLAVLPADAEFIDISAHPDIRQPYEAIEARLHTRSWARPARAVLARPRPDEDWLPGVVIDLDGEQWLAVLFYTEAPNAAPPPTTIALYLGAVLLVVGVIAVLIARVAGRSLAGFARAAERLSTDLNAPPLPERGPVEVVRVAAAFNRMQSAIRRHLDERTEILAAVSHDLKTPLTRLRLRAENLPDELPQRARFIADIEAMTDLVGEGLDYARSAQLREARSPVDLDRLVAALADDARDTGARVEVSGRLGAPVIAAPRALQRAVQNLLDNALRYGDGAAEITLERLGGEDDGLAGMHASGSAQSRPDAAAARLRLTVADRGPGLAPELLERVFEPFYRVEGSRSRASGGTGLGLAIARNLVRGQGGDIVLANRPGGGLLAVLELPAG